MPSLTWRERTRPIHWWTRLLVRTFARADVLAPDGRSYLVRVVPVLWPRKAPILDGVDNIVQPGAVVSGLAVLASLFTSRAVWGVRVLREPGGFGVRTLMYGEEFRDFDDSVARARQIANRLEAGKAP